MNAPLLRIAIGAAFGLLAGFVLFGRSASDHAQCPCSGSEALICIQHVTDAEQAELERSFAKVGAVITRVQKVQP